MSITAIDSAPAYVWTGRILSGLVVAFLTLDAGMKLVPVQPVIDAMRGLGFPDTPELARGLGALLLACTILYAFPRTAVLGALLLTGYLGGAVALHLRLSHPWLSHVLFGAYVGMAAWAGLLARRPELRTLIFS
jgi:DoxX-like family